MSCLHLEILSLMLKIPYRSKGSTIDMVTGYATSSMGSLTQLITIYGHSCSDD